MGRRVLRFDSAFGAEGCGIALRAMSIYAVSRQFILAPTGAVPPQRQRGFITTLGGALKQSGRRQPVPDRTLGAQGRQPRSLHQPSRRSRVNLWKYSLPLSPPERSEHNPSIQPAAKRRPFLQSGIHHSTAMTRKKRPRKGAFHHISPRIRMTRMRMGRMNWKYGFSQRGIFMPLPLFTSSM